MSEPRGRATIGQWTKRRRSPEEVRAIFFVIVDINANLNAIRDILEDVDGEAEEDDR